MPARTPEDRSLVAQIAAAERWGRTPDRTAATAPARAGLRAKFARQVDPNGTLDAAEVERCVDHLMHAHMLRMSLKAKAARRKAKEATATAEQAEAELEAMGGGPSAA
jgi:hypothetical protein